MLKFLILISLFCVFLFFYARYIEKNSIFFPEEIIEFNPGMLNLTFEDIDFKTNDGLKINSWFIPNPLAEYTILLCHGNAGNIGNRIDRIACFHKLKFNTFIFDYRGYGKSEGKPSEEGLYLDAEAAYRYLVKEKEIPPDKIILYGASLGGAVAIDLASKVTLRALIVEGSFSSGKEMAKNLYPYLPAFIFTVKLDSITKIKKVRCPKLFIHSVEDEIVPLRLAEELYQASLAPKEFFKTYGSHNASFLENEADYKKRLSSFISKI